MCADPQEGSSGTSSVAQSPPHSARLSTRNPRLPPLNLTAPKSSLPPLAIITARTPLTSKTPLASSRSRLTVSPGRQLSTQSPSSSVPLPSQPSTGLDGVLLPGALRHAASDPPSGAPVNSSAAAPTPAAAVDGLKVPRLSLASQSSLSEVCQWSC